MEIIVPDLFKGEGMANKNVIIIIATKTTIKIFLFSLIKLLPLENIKRRVIKIKEAPKARYEPRVKVNIRLMPIARIAVNSKVFFMLFRHAKKRDIAIGKGTIKYSAK